VYLQVSGAARVTAVSGTLTASRQNGSAPGGPVAVPSMNSITVDSSNTFVAVRSSLAASLNFELPQQWLSAGKLHLQLDHLDIEDVRSTFPCIDCENPGPAGPGGPFGPALVNFHTVPPLRIVLVGVPYMAGTSTVVPRQLDFDMLASWLRRAYPTAEVQLAQQSLATLASPPADCNAVNALLSPLATMAADSRTRFYGLIPDNGIWTAATGMPTAGMRSPTCTAASTRATARVRTLRIRTIRSPAGFSATTCTTSKDSTPATLRSACRSVSMTGVHSGTTS
jgi:hypothetical protein